MPVGWRVAVQRFEPCRRQRWWDPAGVVGDDAEGKPACGAILDRGPEVVEAHREA